MKNKILQTLMLLCSIMVSFASCTKEPEYINDFDNYPIGALIITVGDIDYTLKPEISSDGKVTQNFNQKVNSLEDVVTLKQLSLRAGATSNVVEGDEIAFNYIESDDELFVKSQYELALTQSGHEVIYTITLISDAPSKDLPFLYFVSTNAAEIGEATPRIISYQNDGVYEGFAKVVSDWDNIGFVTKNSDIIYDSTNGSNGGESQFSLALEERIPEGGSLKPNGPWGQWAFQNPDMLWYFTFNSTPGSYELKALSVKLAISGSALSDSAPLTYDSAKRSWSVEADFNVGQFKVVSLPISNGDATLSFGKGSEGELVKDGGDIDIETAGTYTVVIDIFDPEKSTYEVVGISAPEDGDKIQGSFESKFTRYKEGQTFEGTPSLKWSDVAWKNDRIHKQIVLWSEGGQYDGVTYEVSDLKSESGSTISKNDIQLRFCSYITGDDTPYVDSSGSSSRVATKIADALQTTPVASIPANDPLKIWVTINTPKGAAAGVYNGTIEVKYNGDVHQTFEIETQVVNHTLPDPSDWDFHLDIWQFPFQLPALVSPNAPGGWLNPFSPEGLALTRPFYEMLADAGQKTITTYIKDGAFKAGETMIDWSRWGAGDNEFWWNYKSFDAYVEQMISLGIDTQISCFSLVGWDTTIGYWDEVKEEYLYLDYKIGSDEYNAIWNLFLDKFKAHLDEKGWFDKVVLYMDEIHAEDMTKVVSLIKSNNPNWKIGVAGRNQTAENEAQLYDYSTILNVGRIGRQAVSTFYTSCSQKWPNNYVTADNNPAEMTWMAWHTAQQGLDGYLRWAFDNWLKSDPTDAQDTGNTAGDNSMIYRTDNTMASKPVSSIRWELLREGIQDYEKIQLLNNSEVNAKIAAFTSTSGNNAEALVESAQEILKAASAK